MNLYIDNIIFSLQNSGGISVVWKELIARLLADNEFDIKFVEYNNSNFFRKEIDISPELILPDRTPWLPLKIRRYLNPVISIGKGIFHSSYYRIVDQPGIVNITTVHDFTYSFFRKGLPKVIHDKQKEKAINNSKGVICVSENTKRDLMRFYPSVDESKIKVIYNGVNNNFNVISDKIEKWHNTNIPFSSGEFVVYVGDRTSPYKNFHIAVETCKITLKPLVLIGGGILSASDETYLNETLGRKNYYSVGNVSVEDLNLIYNNALCLLYPSSYEGFGIPIIESQKAGCPVICCNCSSIPEVAGNAAILVNKIEIRSFADAVKEMEINTSFRNNIIRDGIINSTRFSWDNNYKQTKEFYIAIYQKFLN